MSNLHTGNQARLEDYPPGIQCLLKDALWHVEQLGLLEREFRAWQATQAKPGETELFTMLDHSAPIIPETTISRSITRLTKIID